MKQKQRIIFFGMVAVALILAACDGDSGNNGVETEVDSSSSGDIFWSSSVAVSSPSETSPSSSTASSSSLACTNTYGTNTVTDCRDGQSYKTVVIGSQTWMAENLNYADSIAMPSLVGNSWCYENSADSCSKYGRLYKWASAMAVDSIYNGAVLGDTLNHQGACPIGWHIPLSSEWNALAVAVGGIKGDDGDYYASAGVALKSTHGWNNHDGARGNGTDSYGFSALPAGFRDFSGGFGYVGSDAYFWSASEIKADSAYYRYLYNYITYMGTHGNYKDDAFSVRCVKD